MKLTLSTLPLLRSWQFNPLHLPRRKKTTIPCPRLPSSDDVAALTEQEKKHPFSLLVFGGGYSPSGNQVSLESNVKYFRRIRSSMGLGEAAMKTYFADGKSKDRDLQFSIRPFVSLKQTKSWPNFSDPAGVSPTNTGTTTCRLTTCPPSELSTNG